MKNKFFSVCLFLFMFSCLGLTKVQAGETGGRITYSIDHSTNIATITYDYGSATSFRLLMTSGSSDGVWQPLTPGMIVGVAFPSAGKISWKINTNVNKVDLRLFKVEHT